MTNERAPMSDPSTLERILLFGKMVIDPHSSITTPSQRRRAQWLNAIALIFTILIVVGLIIQYRVAIDFSFMLLVSIGTFLLGKSKYPRAGVFLFSLGTLSIAYIALYIGYADNFSLTVLAVVPAALILVNALTSQRTFIGFAILTTLAAFLAPYYSRTIIAANDAPRISGIILAINVFLYGVNAVRSNIERTYRIEVRAKDQQIQAAKTDIEKLISKYAQEMEKSQQQIKKQAAQLRVTSELSQEISASINKDSRELLTYITQIISQQLGYYHVGIFLLDKNRQYAELRAANSAGGQRMLERRHQLKVGGAGIVGYVSQSGYPRIALSTGADAVFFNNPDLPETKSEMALPLKIGEQVIGVLDVQSPHPAAFSEEDTHIFTALANQIALVVQNRQGGGQFIQPLDKKNMQETTNRQSKQNGYAYLADGTIALSQVIRSPILDKALASGEVIAQPASSQNALPLLTIPVKIREQVIGYIYIEAAETNRKWTEDEIVMAQSVSERAAFALENARLFEETERRAEQEQIMARMTSRIGESTTFERILQTTIQEIGRTLGAKRTFIQLESLSSDEDAAEMDRGI